MELHAFTGTDYTAVFHRKGKVKARKLVADDDDARWVSAFNTLCHGFDGDKKSLEAFVWVLYGERHSEDINEARRKKLYKLAKWKKCPRPIQIAQSQLCADSALSINFRAKDGKSKFRCQCVDASNYTPRPCQEMDPKDFG